MSNYYYALVFITVIMMATIIIHLFENETLSRSINSQLMLIASLIAMGVICEFLGIFLNNIPECSKYFHGMIKAIKYTIAPIIPICYVKIVEDHDLKKEIRFPINFLLYFNSLCELISIFIPFVFFIDENNVYKHGTYYLIYMISYFTGIIIFIIALLKYTKKYQSRNIGTLVSMISFLLMGFAIRLVDSHIYIYRLANCCNYVFIVYNIL